MKKILKYGSNILGVILIFVGITTFISYSTPQTVYLIMDIMLILMSIFMCFLAKIMVVDVHRFSGYLQKEFLNGKQQWFFKNDFGRKLPLSKIYDKNNIDTSRLKEGEFYKQLILDKNGGFIIPQWSIFQIEKGYLPDRHIKELDDKYLNSESFWQILIK